MLVDNINFKLNQLGQQIIASLDSHNYNLDIHTWNNDLGGKKK